MNTLVTTVPRSAADCLASPLTADIAPSRATRAPAARTAIELLRRLQGGVLRLALPGGDQLRFGEGHERAALTVHDSRLFERTLAEGDIGFGESYIDGEWDSDDLAALLTLLAENRDTLDAAIRGQWWPLLRHRLRHWLRSNTRTGSRRNILAHYDLGNDFYALWLDPTMSYSAALFGDSASSGGLAAAQRAKYLRLLDRLDARPGQTILEIGCGWGGFAEVAARDYGCRVHGITLSPAQLAYARERAAAGGWADRAEFKLVDYRDLQGRYDHIVSIEMFEAVGERYWPSYFRQLRDRLKPGGRAAIQTITIADERFSAYRRGTDFIQRHVFPGGMLPSPAAFERRAASADFRVADRYAFGLDYARTLALWRESFEAAWPRIARLGFDERFRRLWRFYLAYCEAGFRAGTTDVCHYLLERR
jgi:cyclopropane-fatty-acyl-phospholipid synthase